MTQGPLLGAVEVGVEVGDLKDKEEEDEFPKATLEMMGTVWVTHVFPFELLILWL